MQINIHDIGNYALRNYLLETEKGIIAIDTGYPGGCDRFVQRFTKKWPLSELKYIFLTHHHDDHAGFLGDLLDRTDAQVVLHHKAIPALAEGKSMDPPGSGYSSRLAATFSYFKKDFAFPAVTIPSGHLISLHTESEQFFEKLGLPLRILFLPGHTVDSIALFLPETGQLFCGDAAMNAIISVAKHTIWIDDAEKFQASWDKMIALACKKIYPSHGSPFAPKALTKHRHYLDGRALISPHS